MFTDLHLLQLIIGKPSPEYLQYKKVSFKNNIVFSITYSNVYGVSWPLGAWGVPR